MTSGRTPVWRIVVILVAAALLAGHVPAVSAKDDHVDFAGGLSGQFVPDADDLPPGRFYVFESALGEVTDPDLAGRLGSTEFSYATVAVYDHNDLPHDLPGECDPVFSSVADGGEGTMFFSEGELTLTLKDGLSCFIFPSTGPPLIELSATFRITGGTGMFKRARGELEFDVIGLLPARTMTADITGDIRLK